MDMEKNKKLKVFIGTLIFSMLFALFFKWWTTGNPFHSTTILFGTIIFTIILISLSISNTFFGYFLAMPIKKVKMVIIPAFLLFMVIILLISLMVIGVQIYLFHLIMGLDTTHFINNLFEVEFPQTIKYYSVCALIASAFFFYSIWQQAVDREQQLREENLKYKYRTLKTQVNPHFLFNSLNTLSEIIYEDTRKADNYIQQLASIYRYILDNEETDLIPLKEEIRFVNRYFSLQKERDGEKIQLEINIQQVERYSIVPISLQILVENALKHNSASEKNPLRIIIQNENDPFIVISNNMQKRSTWSNSPGTGLSNLKERVRLIMGKEMTIETEQNQFTVKLPINII